MLPVPFSSATLVTPNWPLPRTLPSVKRLVTSSVCLPSTLLAEEVGLFVTCSAGGCPCRSRTTDQGCAAVLVPQLLDRYAQSGHDSSILLRCCTVRKLVHSKCACVCCSLQG